MKNKELVEIFACSMQVAKTKNLMTDGYKLWSYEALIAVKVPGGVYLNAHKYTQTTSSHQNLVRQYCNVVAEFEYEVEMVQAYHELSTI